MGNMQERVSEGLFIGRPASATRNGSAVNRNAGLLQLRERWKEVA